MLNAAEEADLIRLATTEDLEGVSDARLLIVMETADKLDYSGSFYTHVSGIARRENRDRVRREVERRGLSYRSQAHTRSAEESLRRARLLKE